MPRRITGDGFVEDVPAIRGVRGDLAPLVEGVVVGIGARLLFVLGFLFFKNCC